MSRLDPKILFELIEHHVPKELQQNLIIVGSLAAAYHYRAELKLGGVNTKDADVIVHPAGALAECRMIAERLLADGWRPLAGKCYPSPAAEPASELRVIRLNPPTSEAFFIELLAFPDAQQAELKRMVPLGLKDGWYCLPSFRFMGFMQYGAVTAGTLRYAAPEMMALSNLLSHPTLGIAVVSEPIEGRQVNRAAKDLGRVLALSLLAGRDETEAWEGRWRRAIQDRFPDEAAALREQAASGIRALLKDRAALDDARHSADVGLLAGRGITVENLVGLAEQLLVDALEPLAR